MNVETTGIHHAAAIAGKSQPNVEEGLPPLRIPEVGSK
jgi:hypothetical protein